MVFTGKDVCWWRLPKESFTLEGDQDGSVIQPQSCAISQVALMNNVWLSSKMLGELAVVAMDVPKDKGVLEL